MADLTQARERLTEALNTPFGVFDGDEVAEAIQTVLSALDSLQGENERLREAHERIDQWSQAYPLDIFPEPDFAKAHEVLKAAGMTLDAISASNMRHVVEGVGKIASQALEPDNG